MIKVKIIHGDCFVPAEQQVNDFLDSCMKKNPLTKLMGITNSSCFNATSGSVTDTVMIVYDDTFQGVDMSRPKRPESDIKE